MEPAKQGEMLGKIQGEMGPDQREKGFKWMLPLLSADDITNFVGLNELPRGKPARYQ